MVTQVTSHAVVQQVPLTPHTRNVHVEHAASPGELLTVHSPHVGVPPSPKSRPPPPPMEPVPPPVVPEPPPVFVKHWPALHVALVPQLTHVAPSTPHTADDCPAWHVPCASQQPAQI